MQTSKYLIFSLFIAITLFVTACGDDDTMIENPEEVITTLTYTLTPDGGGNTVVFSFVDLDGDGGNAPVLMTDNLQANTTYQGAIALLNESESPAEDIGEEVAEEDLEHQLFYVSTVPGLTVSYSDADSEGNPVGLETTLVTGDAGTGTLTIILRHEPDKSATGVAEGSIANAGGETDIEVVFDVIVQ